METLFQLATLYIMPFWLLMLFLPFWTWTQRIMTSWWPIIPLAAAYVAGFIITMAADPGALASIANPNLDGIRMLLGTPAGATVGWIHFLAFDLFVGRWAYLDSRTRGLSPWIVSPALFFILMSGPLGLLLYLGVRALARPRPVAANA
jgi:hypothetical protein